MPNAIGRVVPGLLIGMLTVAGAVAQPATTAPVQGCAVNDVRPVEPGRSIRNDCARPRYLVDQAYLDRLYDEHSRLLALAAQLRVQRDSLVHMMVVRTAVQDSARAVLDTLAIQMHRVGVGGLERAAVRLGDTEAAMRAAVAELRAAQADLDRIRRPPWYTRLRRAALPALAGLAVGVLLARK